MLTSSCVSQYGSQDWDCMVTAGFLEGPAEGTDLDEVLVITRP